MSLLAGSYFLNICPTYPFCSNVYETKQIHLCLEGRLHHVGVIDKLVSSQRRKMALTPSVTLAHNLGIGFGLPDFSFSAVKT